jgi:hypothetical protein
MMLDYTKLAIAIVTWKRPKELQRTLHAWTQTLPDYRAGYIIANHQDSVNVDVQIPERFTVIPTGRPPEHAGNLSQSWNLAMLWAFRDPAVEWLLCSQDDVDIRSGWVEAIQSSPDRDLYLAPAGDQVFLFNRSIFNEVGWFDERYTTIGYHEWDWQARVCRAFPQDRLSIEDAHGWSVNGCGLGTLWQRTDEPENGYKDEAHIGRNLAWMQDKWGIFLKNVMPNRVPEPHYGEIEWYPWHARCQQKLSGS